MNALLWLLRGVLFVVLLGLAIKNASDVELRFYFDTVWRVPLSLALLAALAIGVALGLLALLPQVIRLRRRVSRLERRATAPEPTDRPKT
ncbi:lipopolysaccharide assembly protein LapA domain-containing protein [Sulfuricystis multivorans]|uniref:lipopolysaccharide assembly protein LapA domain-containing protein n=1 Tax=Sulfuricystis multivorans TaxID=2211108 RepID=UPI000F83958E|nr:lipopolysaccharide assembly protein LapA domain-containing protein [Sulfuricystis multivorans]